MRQLYNIGYLKIKHTSLQPSASLGTELLHHNLIVFNVEISTWVCAGTRTNTLQTLQEIYREWMDG